MISLFQFLELHRARKSDGMRLGQRFCVMYVKGPMPELFYAQDEQAHIMIHDWLERYQYLEALPPQRGVDWNV